MRLTILLAAILAVVGIGLQLVPRPATSRHVLQAYGDSILWESASAIGPSLNARPGWAFHVHAVSGTAPCDWINQLKRDLASTNASVRPTVVMLEFTGNSWTKCMSSPSTGKLLVIGTRPWLEKYRTDFDTFFSTASARGVPTVVLRPITLDPKTTLAKGKPFADVLDNLYAVALEEADKYPLVVSNESPRRAVALNGSFSMHLPCLSDETLLKGCKPDGTILVREPPGLHFCPVGYPKGPTVPCAVYSSGAKRFGSALATVAHGYG